MPLIVYQQYNFRKQSRLLIDVTSCIIAEYQEAGYDLTLRQLYYQFVARGVIPNNQKEYNKLGVLISKARLAGLIDWDAIIDRTRNNRGNNHFTDPGDILSTAANAYKLDTRAYQDYYIEVWVEKDALIGVIEPVCLDLDINYLACRGYMSQSAMWEAANRMNDACGTGQKSIVLHIGDHDPSGLDMTRDIKDRLALFGVEAEIIRIALNNDKPGRRYLTDVKSYLQSLTPEPKMLVLNPAEMDLQEKEDAVDYVEQLKVLGKSENEIKSCLADVLKRAKQAGPIAEYQEHNRRVAVGELLCLLLPWPVLALLSRLGKPGWLVILAGLKGAAKTFFELQLLLYWLKQGISASAYWLEGDRTDLLDRTLAQVSGIADVTDMDWKRDNAETVRELTEQYKDELERVASAVTVSAGLGLETLEDIATWIEKQVESGKRAIFVDPITAATRKGKPWEVDPGFVRRAKRAARDNECTVIVITHLIKGAEEGKPDKVAGSAAYGNLSDCVLQLMRHDPKPSLVKTDVGRMEETHTHTIFIEKTRAPGSGYRIAFSFTKSLTFTEHGVILRKET